MMTMMTLYFEQSRDAHVCECLQECCARGSLTWSYFEAKLLLYTHIESLSTNSYLLTNIIALCWEDFLILSKQFEDVHNTIVKLESQVHLSNMKVCI